MNATTTKNPAAAWRRIASTAIGASAIAVGLIGMTAPIADASPKSDCGLYDSRDKYTTSTDSNGNVTEKCCYYSGLVVELWTCRTWVNGTEVSHEQPPAPPVKPAGPPLQQAPNDGVSQPGPTPKPGFPPVRVVPTTSVKK